MPAAKANIEKLGEVRIYRRKGLKHMTLRVSSDGSVRLSLPWLVPKSVGIAFVKKKLDWIIEQRKARKIHIVSGTKIGPFNLKIISSDSQRSWKIDGNQLVIKCKENDDKYIRDSVSSALKVQARTFLPRRLKELASGQSFEYKKVRLSTASTRWGSCSESGTISLNVKLMLLPAHLIDYVIIHELCHTKEMNHSQKFWALVEKFDPNYKKHRKEIKLHHPHI